MKRRIVITGMGVVTPIGVGIKEFENSLREGKSGVGRITRFSTTGFKNNQAFELKNFTPAHGSRLLDPFIQYALTAASEAIQNSGLDLQLIDPYRIGICVGSSKGGLHSVHAFWERFLRNPSAILGARVYSNLVPNFSCQWIARRWKIHGPAKCFITACATGTTSIIEGARMIEEGVVDYAIAGASDASLVPFLVAGYEQMGVLSPDQMRPFDQRRKGFLLGEGAGIVFMETLESARARKATIRAEIIGSSYGSDCYHAVSFNPEGEALARTLKALLQKCDISPDDVGYLNLHGTATKEGDIYETRQIKKAFGKKAHAVSMSTTKPMMGHMLGASGAVEIITCVLAMKGGFIPPTVGLEIKDPECDLDYTAGHSQKKKFSLAVTHSMGFGGHIAAIALKKI